MSKVKKMFERSITSKSPLWNWYMLTKHKFWNHVAYPKARSGVWIISQIFFVVLASALRCWPESLPRITVTMYFCASLSSYNWITLIPKNTQHSIYIMSVGKTVLPLIKMLVSYLATPRNHKFYVTAVASDYVEYFDNFVL